jgi:hypothetical protein
MPLLTELENLFSAGFYKDVAPTALGKVAPRRGGDGGEGGSAAPAEMGGRDAGWKANAREGTKICQ